MLENILHSRLAMINYLYIATKMGYDGGFITGRRCKSTGRSSGILCVQ